MTAEIEVRKVGLLMWEARVVEPEHDPKQRPRIKAEAYIQTFTRPGAIWAARREMKRAGQYPQPWEKAESHQSNQAWLWFALVLSVFSYTTDHDPLWLVLIPMQVALLALVKLGLIAK